MKKNKFKLQSRLLLSLQIIICVIAIAGCAGAKNQKLGAVQLQSGNYEEADKFFEASKSEGNERSEFLLLLGEVKFQLAQKNFTKVQGELDSKDLPTVIADITTAQQFADAAVKAVQKIKAEDKISDNEKKLSEKNDLLKQITQVLETKNAERTDLLGKADALKEMAKNKIEKAFLGFEPLLPYKEFMPELSAAYKELREALILDLDTKGLAALDASKISVAKGLFEKIKKYFPEITKGDEGLLATETSDLYKKKKYKDAYLKLQELKKINAENAYFVKQGPAIKNDLLASEAKGLTALLKEKTIASYMKAIDGYRLLMEVDGVTKEQITGFQEEVKKMRVAIAGLLIKKAKDLSKSKESLPLVWMILKSAWRIDPEQAQTQVALDKEAFDYIKNKGALNAMIFFKSQGEAAQTNAAQSPYELETFLKQQIISSTTKLSNWPTQVNMILANDVLPVEYIYSVKKAQDLSKMPTKDDEKLKNLDVILWANALENKIEEYGANQVIYKTSRFVSSTRMVDNPEWFKVQQELTTAQNDYNNSAAQRQTLNNQCDQMANAFAAAICKGAISGLSTASLDAAQAKYNATPRYLQENVNSDYTYRSYRVGINVSMKLEFQYMDLLSKINYPSKVLEYVVKNKEGDIFEGVMPSDLNGLKNDRVNVPDPASEKTTGQNTLLATIQKEVVEKLTKEKGLRYCHQGEKMLRSSKKDSNYVPLFQLCLLLTQGHENIKEGSDANELDIARKILEKYYPVTAEEIQKYGVAEAELPAPTPENPFTASVQ